MIVLHVFSSTWLSLLALLIIPVLVPACEEEEIPTGTKMMDTVWNVIEIVGEQTHLGMEARHIDLVLAGNGPRIGGFAGCNRFSGSYEIIQHHLVFGDLETTYRSCPRGMEQEDRYMKALANTRSHVHDEDDMTFYNAEHEVILTFRAVHFTRFD